MKREYIQRGILAIFVGALTGGFYFAFGWIGLALLALFELGDIAATLGDIRKLLNDPQQ